VLRIHGDLHAMTLALEQAGGDTLIDAISIG